MNSHFKIFAVVCAMALLVPASAIAKRPEGKPERGHKHGALGPLKKHEPKLHLATANLKGTVTANDGTTMTMTVDKAGGHARACKGASLTFDVSEARFFTADNDADEDMDAMDVLVGHQVKVRTKLALLRGKKTTCAAAEELALHAIAVHNRTTPRVEEEADEGDEAEGDDPADVEEPEDLEGDEPDVDDTEGGDTDEVEEPEEE